MADYRPATLNIQITANDTWKQTFTMTSNNLPLDLNYAVVRIKIANSCNGTSLIATNDSGITVTGVDFNIINVDKAITLAYGDYEWDLQVTYPDLQVTTYLKGDFTILQDL